MALEEVKNTPLKELIEPKFIIIEEAAFSHFRLRKAENTVSMFVVTNDNRCFNYTIGTKEDSREDIAEALYAGIELFMEFAQCICNADKDITCSKHEYLNKNGAQNATN